MAEPFTLLYSLNPSYHVTAEDLLKVVWSVQGKFFYVYPQNDPSYIIWLGQPYEGTTFEEQAQERNKFRQII